MHLLVVLGCYMPYWDSAGSNEDDYTRVIAKLDALITAHRSSAPVVLMGDFNCALPRMSAAQRPLNWHRLRGFSRYSVVMQELLDDHQLAVAEFGFPQVVPFTYERGYCSSHIDHITVPESLISALTACEILPPSIDNLSPPLANSRNS